MAESYRVTMKAANDLARIIRYIADDNPAAAKKVKGILLDAVQKLGANPLMGQQREDLTFRPVRFWPAARSYLVVYDPRPRPVPILHVFHAARDVTVLLS